MAHETIILLIVELDSREKALLCCNAKKSPYIMPIKKPQAIDKMIFI